MRTKTAIILLLLAGSLGCAAASAQEVTAPVRAPELSSPNRPPAKQQALTLTPAVMQFSSVPGQTVTQTLKLENTTPFSFEFEMVAEDVTVKAGHRVFVPAGEIPASIASTAVFSQERIRLAPGETATVELMLTIPAQVKTRAVVAIFKGTNRISSGKSMNMTASIGALLTFSLSDETRLQSTAIKFVRESASTNAMVSQTLTNVGQEPIIPKGVVAIVNEAGEIVGKLQYPEQRLLPGEELEFKAEYPGELHAGHYQLHGVFEFAGKTVAESAAISIP